MQRVLDERHEDFARMLTDAGFSPTEADRFVVEAGSALLRSYEWQERSHGLTRSGRPYAAREILSTISGRRLASRVGLSEHKAWAGLRELVPAVLRASGGDRAGGASGAAPGGRGHDPHERRAHFDAGFGLSVDMEGLRAAGGTASADPNGSRPRIGARHPIFGPLFGPLD